MTSRLAMPIGIKRGFVGLVLAGFLLAVPTSALASQIFYFSFAGDSDPFFGMTKLLGTVSGQIVLPDGNGTFLPTSVTVTSYSAGLTGAIDLNLTPTTWGTQVGSGFTVLGGVMTGAFWAAQTGASLGFDQIRFNYEGFNAFFLDGGGVNAIANDEAFAGVTYSTASAAVPEPASFLLLGTGLAAVAARRRFTKRT